LKTQYTPLVKIKKQYLDKMEQAVSSCHETIAIVKQKIEDAYVELNSIVLPNDGNFSIFTQMQVLKHRAQEDIKFQKYNLELSENALVKAMQQLKTANIEYEKFMYLETTEIDKIIKAQKLQEAKELDEIALISFNRKAKS